MHRNAVCIICTDHHRSTKFYVDALGAVVLEGDVGTCPWLRIGDLNLTLVPNAASTSTLEHSESAMAMIFLQVEDLTAAYERAISNGATPVDPPKEDGVHFVIADPDGILIEVMQYSPD